MGSILIWPIFENCDIIYSAFSIPCSLPAVDCGDPLGPGPDGLVDFTDTTLGSSATYTCTTTCYGLDPNTPTRTCMANSEWSGDDPTCQCKSVVNLFLAANFQLEYIQFSLSC